jgi:hypothetical protein
MDHDIGLRFRQFDVLILSCVSVTIDGVRIGNWIY